MASESPASEPNPKVVRHTIDPEGDVILVLSNPGAPFAPWNPDEDHPCAVKLPEELQEDFPLDIYFLLSAGSKTAKVTADSDSGKKTAVNGQQAATTDSDSEGSNEKKTIEIRYRVNSACLRLASPYFKKLFSGSWRETITKKKGLFYVTAQDWDPTALLLLMNIFHCQGQKILWNIDLEMLAKLAALADYYLCATYIRHYAMRWRALLDIDLSKATHSRPALLLLFSAITFEWDDTFTKLTAAIMWHSHGPIQTLGLPFPQPILDAINNRRVERLDQNAEAIAKIKQFLKVRAPCSVFECTVLRHGVFRVDIYSKKIHPKLMKECKDGYSIAEVLNAFKNLR
ncbi:BTB/POZ domain-containing protein [Pochonia chlamydosporia 170]|uniref:BTB/POZ domain-containing protein n=1 Tax=Pochonia chlamydosporia 170 TaxID=1380566 RepID=A0A179FMQ6_METCM|nr:BTB/POZ domain-containing protein [Pochonia chlamydosporia 170]OAQ66353.1 BTB/POZ domain-containing protein [Pochonia chlamydosporia 170]